MTRIFARVSTFVVVVSSVSLVGCEIAGRRREKPVEDHVLASFAYEKLATSVSDVNHFSSRISGLAMIAAPNTSYAPTAARKAR